MSNQQHFGENKNCEIKAGCTQLRGRAALLCTTALVAAATCLGGALPEQAHAQVACAPDVGTFYRHEEIPGPVDLDITRDTDICYERVNGETWAIAIDSRNWDDEENALTVRGSIRVEAKSSDNRADTSYTDSRGIYTSGWAGSSNTLTNYASIVANTQAGINSRTGVAKSFGIYTENWDGDTNALFNYGNISSTVSGGSGANANEPHGIRMGAWNDFTPNDFTSHYFENWGDITTYGTAADGSAGNAVVIGGIISNQGMHAEENILLNYGNLTGTAFGGDNAAGEGFAIMRGINLSNQTSTGEYIYVGNWGDITLYAQGRDNAGNHIFGEANGIEFRGIGTEIQDIAIENYGNIDVTAKSGLNGTSGFTDAWATGLRVRNMDASGSALLANHGVIRVHAEDTYSAHTRAYGITFGVSSRTAQIRNTGLIEVTADSPNGRAVGIGTLGLTGNFDGHVYNTGKIVARGTGGLEDNGGNQGGFVIYLGPVSAEQEDDEDGKVNVPSVELSTLGFLEGRIRLGGQSIIVDNSMPSHSVHWTAEDTTGNPNWGEAQGAVFYSADGFSAATYDMSLLASQNTITEHLSRSGSENEAAQINAALARSSTKSYPLAAKADAEDNGNWQVWGGAYHSQLDLDGSERGIFDSETDSLGIVAGGVTEINDMALGLSFGALTSETEFSESRWMKSLESDFKTYFLGAKVATAVGPMQASIGARIGTTQFDTKRHVNNNLVYGGIETATSDQDTNWLSLSAELAYNVDTVDGVMLTPFAAVNYFMARHEDFREVGIDSAADVEERDTSLTRAEIGFRGSKYIVPLDVTLSTTAKAFFSWEGGDDGVTMTMKTLSADAQDIAVVQTDASGLSIGINVEKQFSDKISLNSGVTMMATEAGDTGYSAGLALKAKF
ncbi:MAG: autotransporter outer membrane beta-barrel domain-containing protein [Rhizobiaceae bacterium]